MSSAASAAPRGASAQLTSSRGSRYTDLTWTASGEFLCRAEPLPTMFFTCNGKAIYNSSYIDQVVFYLF